MIQSWDRIFVYIRVYNGVLFYAGIKCEYLCL